MAERDWGHWEGDEVEPQAQPPVYQAAMPRRRMLGVSDVWRGDGTGTADFYVFWLRVWRLHFHHSTTYLEPFSTPALRECVRLSLENERRCKSAPITGE